MMQLPNPQAENVKKDGHVDQLSNLLLLNSRQWLYVQSRYNLTPRERQIAELICQGQRSCNIAGNLHIKPGTVKTHTRNIYRKVRVKSKIAMLLRFVSDTRELSVS
jgi:DNA-binding NarL/FixJ family response regulator